MLYNVIMIKQKDVFTIAIGGSAGDGIREVGINLGSYLASLGFESHFSFKYPSLIRGGHNYTKVSFSEDKVFYDHLRPDVLIALNEDTIKRRGPELAEKGIIFAEDFDEEDSARFGNRAVRLPMAKLATELGAPSIAKTSVALGALSYFLDFPRDKMTELLRTAFKTKNEDANVRLSEAGYAYIENLGLRHPRKFSPKEPAKEFVEGNAALGRGLVAAGLDLYIAYPMTPSSSLLHFLAQKKRDYGIKVVHPENELSVINMALGAAYAGKKTAIGTAGGGFALMQESFSLAGMSETPLVVVVSQRYAPATGVPTHSGQGDLRFVVHAGHGEFPRIVLAPGDPEEAYDCGGLALRLAWKYQLPVIILIDKHVSENYSTSVLREKVEKAEAVMAKNPSANYKRYAITENGISPLVFPGTAGAIVKTTSYEHDEEGLATEEAEEVNVMQEKRFRKMKTLARELARYETVKIYGDPKAEAAVVFWGSGKTVVLEAAKFFRKPAQLVQLMWMEPFDVKKVSDCLVNTKVIIDVEYNHDAQLAGLIREKTGIEVTHKILRYDAKPFDPESLAEKINEII